MYARALLSAVLFAIFLSSCGNGEDYTLFTPAPTPHTGSKEELLARARAATETINTGKWLDYYDFKSPRSVKPRFPYGLPGIQLCSKEQFIYDTGERLSRLRFDTGIPEEETVKWDVVDATIERNVAWVSMAVYHKNQPLVTDKKDYFGENEKGVRWIYMDANWWQEDEDWLKGCHEGTVLGN